MGVDGMEIIGDIDKTFFFGHSEFLIELFKQE